MKMSTVQERTDNALTAIHLIALKENRSPEEVRQSIKIAMLIGMLNESPEIRKIWQSIPCENEYPEPEEVILWISEHVKQKLKEYNLK